MNLRNTILLPIVVIRVKFIEIKCIWCIFNVRQPMSLNSAQLSSFRNLHLCHSLSHPFLVADTQLYKRLCPSVGRSVGRSVMVIELKMSVFDALCVSLSVGGGLGCGWGLDAPAHPSATIL